MKVPFVVSISSLALAAAFLMAKDGDSNPSTSGTAPTDVLAQLRSDDPAIRDEARRAVHAERSRLLHELQHIILRWHTRPEKRDIVASAIRLLGEMRGEQAVPTLLEAIEFDKDVQGGLARRPYAVRPQIAALIDIGLPSLDPLVALVAKGAKPIVVERAALVIYGILGHDFARLFVQDRVEREKDAVKRERLESLKEYIDQFGRREMNSGGPPWPTPTLSPDKR